VTTFGDLATAGPSASATITSSGKALVILTAKMSNSSNSQSIMGFAVSGATTLSASDAQSLVAGILGGASSPQPDMQGSATYLVTGLTAGSNTFTAKYRISGNTGTFANRNIIVIPLP
jgi:fructose-specific phosphotransferase system IIC component